MDSDDDICVLQSSPENSSNITIPTQPIYPFSPLSSRPLSDLERGSHYALQKAFTDLTLRLQQSNAKNEALAKRVKELEQAEISGISSIVGESYDMMEDAAYSSAAAQGSVGAAGMQQTAVDQLGAEQGYTVKVQRELVHTKMQLDDFQKKYNEMAASYGQQLKEARNQVASLTQEKTALTERCKNLQIEKEKAQKQESALQESLQKANQEVAILKEKQAENEPPPELVAELTNMRKVIDSLKKMVLAQRRYLEERGMSMSSMGRSLRGDNSVQSDLPPLSTQGHGSRGSNGSGSGSMGASWEMVNGVAPPTLNPRSQQQQQQQQQLAAMQQRSLTSAGPGSDLSTKNLTPRSSLTPKSSLNGSLETGRLPNGNGNVSGNRSQAFAVGNTSVSSGPGLVNGPAMANVPAMSNGPTFSNGFAGGVSNVGAQQQKAKTEFIRRRSEDEIAAHGQSKSKTEVIRSNTLPPGLSSTQSNAPGLGQWMGSHYTQQQQPAYSQQGGMPGQGLNQLANQNQYGLNQFSPQRSQAGGGSSSGGFDNVQGGAGGIVTRGGQNMPNMNMNPNMGLNHYQAPPPPPPPKSPLRQQSPMHGDLTSAYDNLTMGNSGTSNNNAVPSSSMHIFNQNAYAGARVVQSCSQEYGSRGGVAISTNHLQGITTGIGRDGTSRGSPQEHIDLSPAGNLELTQFHPIHFENDISPNGGNNGPTLDRKCPVCTQDFSHISMDQFQTHVFECFDDVEEVTGPETLQAVGQHQQIQQQFMPTPASMGEKVCPMCEKIFPGNTTQGSFEQHVQCHFEEVDPFEVLQPPKS